MEATNDSQRRAIFRRSEVKRFSRLGNSRLAKLLRVAKKHYDTDPDTAAENAEAEVRDIYGSILTAILLKLAIEFVVFLIKRWLENRLTQAPSRIEYDDEHESGTEDDDDGEFKWGEPPTAIRQSYVSAGYSARGRFNGRDAGSTLETAVMLQPMVLATSYAIEQYAAQANPATSGIAVFSASYLAQMLVALALKIAANLLRNFGSSLIRDLGAWLWYHFMSAIGATMWESLTGWLPWRRRRRRKLPQPDSDPDDSPIPDNARRRPIIDWLFPRRRAK